jgi:hypothetical protein
MINKTPNNKTLTDKLPIIKTEVIIPNTGKIGIFPILKGTLKPSLTGFLVLEKFLFYLYLGLLLQFL